MATELNGDVAGATARYDKEADAFVFYDPIHEDETIYPAFLIDVDEKDVVVYPIGAREWTWEII